MIETIFEILEGNTALDCIAATCLIAVAIGLPLCIFGAIFEFVANKFNLTDKIVNFFSDSESEE